jgi:uncharacterized protein YndB with AHSA1/START domain
MDGQSHKLELSIERVLPAPIEVVVAACTEADQLAKWWGPEGFAIPDLDFEPQVGSSYRISMQPPQGDAFSLHGEFQVVELPRRLAFTFVWDPANPDDVETLADLTFGDHSGSTTVALRQTTFKTEERVALHRGGWTESFDKLVRLLAAGRHAA